MGASPSGDGWATSSEAMLEGILVQQCQEIATTKRTGRAYDPGLQNKKMSLGHDRAEFYVMCAWLVVP